VIRLNSASPSSGTPNTIACRTFAFHRSADIAELPVDTGDELVGEQMMRPSASDELVEFDRTGRRDRRRPIVIGVRARGAGDEPISCARSGLDA
jgi:hypothetical protein